MQKAVLNPDGMCNTCGDSGYAEQIVTCSKCKLVRSHLYCMQTIIYDIPDFWLCDLCVLGEAKSPGDSGLKVQVQPRMQGHTKISKVKYLSAEEVIKLSSGGVKGSAKLNMASAPQRTSSSKKFPSSYIPRKLFQASNESQERSHGMMPPPKGRGVKIQPAVRLPSIAVQTIKKAKVSDILARAATVKRPLSPVMNTGPKDALLSTKEINIDCSYLPALNASWMGGFRFVDSLVAGQFYGGFLAKPPCAVHRKAYEFAQKMPPVLQVKLLARSDIWDDLFHHDFPHLGDIALYFFPSENIERSRENNSSLFELMERENLLIRSSFDGAELLIFTSRQLDADSQYVVNMLNSECLLFGIFRGVENNQSLVDKLGGCSTIVPSVQHPSPDPLVESASIVPKLEYTFSGNGNCDDGNVIEMEIDMVGGKDIGKPSSPLNDLDSTIQQLLLEFGSQQPKANQEPVPISSIGPNSPLLSKVKTELFEGTGREGIDYKKRLQTDKRSRMVPTFSLDGSQNQDALFDEVGSRRVADKYLQIFNEGIKKEPH